MCIAAAAIPAVTLAVSAASAVASVGMGIYSAQQQASQAQASMNMQASQAQQQARMQQQQQRQQLIQNQELQRNQQIFSRDQQMQTQQLQVEQQRKQQELQVQQANVQIANQYNQQRQQVTAERDRIMKQYSADRIGYIREQTTNKEQKRFNSLAANEVYKQEQTKITEAKKKAAFASQTALAKSIGAKGSILAAGRTGQSVGLLVNDAERQSGFEQAQANAMMESQVQASEIGMDQAFLQNQSANQQSDNKVGFNPELPYMPSMPGIPNYIDIDQ